MLTYDEAEKNLSRDIFWESVALPQTSMFLVIALDA